VSVRWRNKKTYRALGLQHVEWGNLSELRRHIVRRGTGKRGGADGCRARSPFKVGKNLLDHRRVVEATDYLERSLAVWAKCNVDLKDAL